MSEPGLESTVLLLKEVREGDATTRERARERLLARYLPVLRRWAHGRLPIGARSLSDTDDLVQVTFLRVLKHMEGFEPRHEGAFLGYLRQALLNAMRDEIRRSARRGRQEELGESLVAPGPSPLETALGRDALDRYEAALAKIPQEQQEAIFMRMEMGFTYEQIAEALEKRTASATRMMVTRALARLASEMEEPHA